MVCSYSKLLSLQVGVHDVMTLKGGSTPIWVDQSEALLHHYRLWDDHALPFDRIVDRHMHRYASTILKRTVDAHRAIENDEFGRVR